jgi:hypothetical protein
VKLAEINVANNKNKIVTRENGYLFYAGKNTLTHINFIILHRLDPALSLKPNRRNSWLLKGSNLYDKNMCIGINKEQFLEIYPFVAKEKYIIEINKIIEYYINYILCL